MLAHLRGLKARTDARPCPAPALSGAREWLERATPAHNVRKSLSVDKNWPRSEFRGIAGARETIGGQTLIHA
jgi:hypothetical protein